MDVIGVCLEHGAENSGNAALIFGVCRERVSQLRTRGCEDVSERASECAITREINYLNNIKSILLRKASSCMAIFFRLEFEG